MFSQGDSTASFEQSGEAPLLTGCCPNETIDDAGALIHELLTAHPDIVAARDLPTHPFNPGYVDAANADVLTEQLVSGVRLEFLDGLRQAGFVVVAELLLLDPLRHAAAQT